LPAVLATLVALLFPLNTHVGLERRAWFEAGFAPFERDLQAGMPGSVLAQRHYPFMLHWDVQLMEAGLQRLHEAGIGPFSNWKAAGVVEPALFDKPAD
jgi:hypothetical protein